MTMYINPSNSHTLNTLSLNAGFWTAASIEVSNSSSVNYTVNRKVSSNYFIDSISNTDIRVGKNIFTDITSAVGNSELKNKAIRKKLGTSNILGDTEFVIYLFQATVSPSFSVISSTDSNLTARSIKRILVGSSVNNSSTCGYSVANKSYMDSSAMESSSSITIEGTRYKPFTVSIDDSTYTRLTIQIPYYTGSSIASSSAITVKPVNLKKFTSDINNISSIDATYNKLSFINTNIVGDTESVVYLSKAIISPAFIFSTTSSDFTINGTKAVLVDTAIDKNSILDTSPHIRSTFNVSSIIGKTNSSLKVNRKFFRTVDIIGDTETLAYHPYRASYTSVVPVTATAKCKYYISTILPTIINSTDTRSTIDKVPTNINVSCGSRIGNTTELSYAGTTRVHSDTVPVEANTIVSKVPTVRGITNSASIFSYTGGMFKCNIVTPVAFRIEPVSYCKYKVRRDRYINNIPVEENAKLISKDLLLYKDDYLKIDLCVHKQEEQPLYATETQSLFYM